MFRDTSDCVIRLKKDTGNMEIVINKLKLDVNTCDTIKSKIETQTANGWQIESIKFYPEGMYESLQKFCRCCG